MNHGLLQLGLHFLTCTTDFSLRIGPQTSISRLDRLSSRASALSMLETSVITRTVTKPNIAKLVQTHTTRFSLPHSLPSPCFHLSPRPWMPLRALCGLFLSFKVRAWGGSKSLSRNSRLMFFVSKPTAHFLSILHFSRMCGNGTQEQHRQHCY